MWYFERKAQNVEKKRKILMAPVADEGVKSGKKKKKKRKMKTEEEDRWGILRKLLAISPREEGRKGSNFSHKPQK